MRDIFVSLLDMSLAPGLLIAAIALVRLFKGIPKKTRCVLWGFAALRLMFPFSLESIFSLIPKKEVTEEIRETIPVIKTVTSAAPENTAFPSQPPIQSYTEAIPADDIIGIASAVWLGGLMLMLLYMAVSLVRVRISVREAVRQGDFFLCDRISGAFILGIICPRIYIPSALEDKKEYIIAHERAHIKRLDHIWKPIGFLLLSVYWFNPLCWLGYILFCRDIELACDETAIRSYDLKHKKEYSQALLEANIRSGYPVSFGGSGIKERVKNVLNYKKPTIWATAASIVLCGIIAVCFLTDPISSESIEAINNVSEENTSEFTSDTAENTTGSSLTEDTAAAEETENSAPAEETEVNNTEALVFADMEIISGSEEERMGYLADAEGNILEYVPAIALDEVEVPKTTLTPKDIDILLKGLSDAKSVAPEDPTIQFGRYVLEDGTVFEASRVITKTFIPVETGVEAFALEDGTVIFSEYYRTCGNTVWVENADGGYIFYNHLSETAVEKGCTVVKGQIIGYAGTTGATSYSGIGYVSRDTLPEGI